MDPPPNPFLPTQPQRQLRKAKWKSSPGGLCTLFVSLSLPHRDHIPGSDTVSVLLDVTPGPAARRI